MTNPWRQLINHWVLSSPLHLVLYAGKNTSIFDLTAFSSEREREREEQEQEAPLTAEKEVGEMSGGVDASEVEADLDSLSGDKPFFDVILSKTHVSPPYRLFLPSRAIGILPRKMVTAVLTHGGKEWSVGYSGQRARPGFNHADWRRFVSDNDLKCEDACIFEVMDPASSSASTVELRVVILRGTDWVPPELKEKVDSRGQTAENAVEIE